MIRVHYANSLELLVDELGRRTASPSAAPLAPETVAVAHPGMRRWLSLELARRHGVAANVRYPLPAALVWQLLRAVLPDIAERSPFEPACLRWAVLGVLDEVAGLPSAAAVRAYLEAADPLMRHELAAKIAFCLDRYLVYRPDWIRRWAQGDSALGRAEGGEHEQWQGHLLRVLRRRLGPTDWLSVLERLPDALAARGPGDLPARVHLFSVTALSPAYVEVLAGFAAHLEVHLYVLNPCREYWGDIVSARARPDAVGEARTSYFTRGNPLLASLGRTGRELMEVLQEVGADEDDAYRDPGAATVLAALQQDVLELRDRSRGEGGGGPPRAGDPADRSIQVHVCHSPRREIEVLHDRLLDLLETHPDLAPSDVVVMAPRIDEYAPAIEAVFGQGDERTRIPFAIADRRPAAASPLVAAYLRLLRIARGRLPADQVVGLLGVGALGRRFGLPPDASAVLGRWVREAGVRWGADGAARARTGAPADELHTWRFGLDRLLLGLAMTGAEGDLFEGLGPYDGVSGGDAELVGGLVAFADALLAFADAAGGERSVAGWGRVLRGVAGRFFEPRGTEESDLQVLLRALDDVVESARRGRFEAEVPLAVVETELLAALAAAGLPGTGAAGSMFTGRVTFCEMVPLRSIPFEVVCLVGMSDGRYPRSEPRLGFDLIEHFPRRGDRTRRDDDRYLFLECILAARRILYVSYVGLDDRENVRLPPSPLVAELVDYLAEGSGVDPREARAALVTEHSLQRFSPRYFAPGSPLFSYHEPSCRASRALLGEASPPPALVATPLVSRLPDPGHVDVEELVAAFLHPARHFLGERLGIRIESVEDVQSAVEPFTVEGLERYRLRQTVLEGLRRGLSPGRLAAGLRGDGQLPSGALGAAVLARESQVVSRYLAEHEELAAPASRLEVDLDLGPLRVTGTLGGWLESERTFELGRLGALRAKDRLEAWIRHLLGSAIVGPARTRFVAVGEVLELAPVTASRAPLADLVSLYLEGTTRPLPFFPASALAFASVLHQGRAAARQAARAAWSGERSGPRGTAGWAEGRDPYNVLAFAAADPLGEDFEAHAQAVFEPMLRHASGGAA